MTPAPNVPAVRLSEAEQQQVLTRLAAAYVADKQTKALYEEARAVADEVLAQIGGKRPAVDVEFPDLGVVAEARRDRTSDEVVVEDRKAWTAYVETHHRGAIEYVVQVLSTWEKARLKALVERADFETGVVADENGEPIPGLRAKRGGMLKATGLYGIGKNLDAVWEYLLDNARPALGVGEEPQSSDAIPMPGTPAEVVDGVLEEERQYAPFPDLRAIGRQARIEGGPGAEELAPGVTRAEADAAAAHAIFAQGGFSTPEIEAGRIAIDRWHQTERTIERLPGLKRDELRDLICQWNEDYPDRKLRLTGSVDQFRRDLHGVLASLHPGAAGYPEVGARQ